MLRARAGKSIVYEARPLASSLSPHARTKAPHLQARSLLALRWCCEGVRLMLLAASAWLHWSLVRWLGRARA